MTLDKKDLEASQCDLDTSIGPDSPRPLTTVLGEDTIRNAVAPFVGYLETAVSVHEHSGVRAGGMLTGNGYCDLLVREVVSEDGKASCTGPNSCFCEHAHREVAQAAVTSASAEERGCFAGMTLRGVPIISERRIVGAVVGAVSEIPSDKKTVVCASEDTGIDYHKLWQATGSSFHKPDYLYLAARQHLDGLAETLGHFYENSLVRDHSVSEILDRESELAKTNQFLKSLLDGMAEAVYTTDNEGRFTYVNPAATAVTGYTREEMLNKNMADLVPEDDRGKMRAMAEQRRQGKVNSYEIDIFHKDGRRLTISQTVAPQFSGEQVVGRVGVVTDITDQRRMENDLLEQRRRLDLLQSVTTRSVSGLTSGRALWELAENISGILGYDYCSIFMPSANGKTLELVARSGDISEDFDELNRSGIHDLDNPAFAQSPPARTFLTGEQIVLENPEKFAGFERLRQVARLLRSHSMVTTPLEYQGERLGVMVIHCTDDRRFTEDELGFLKIVADQISTVAGSARIYERLLKSEERYRDLFDRAADWMYSLTEDGTILDVNSTMVQALGLPKNAIVGKHIYEFETEEDRRRARVDIKEAGKSGIFAAERTFLDQKGARFVVDLHARMFTDDEDRRRWEVIGRDITEQEQMRQHLTQSEKLRALGEMAGGVAHDFNNFLTVILGNTQLLLAQGSYDPDTLDALATIQRASADAAETVRRIQEFTRVRTVRSFTTVDINQIVANAIEVSRPRWRDEAESRGVRVHMDAELNEVPPINGNAAELGEVFLNLMLNAADALPKGGLIKVRTGVVEKDMVEIAITDNGKGMPEEVCQRVFEPFYSTKGPKGSGLGLSLSFGIVNRHGGEILVESREGEGSKFRVLLPIVALTDLPAAEAPEEPVETAAGGGISTGVTIGHGRMLVIEDESMVRTLLADILQQMGQDVETTGTGSQGVRMFQAALAGAAEAGSGPHPFDLVLTDLGMPEMSGWEVVESIKAMSPETPVALITGWGDQLDPEMMKTSGVDVVMAKPFSVTEVKKLVAEALAGKK